MSQMPGSSTAAGHPTFHIERWLCGPVTVMSLVGAFNRPAVSQVYPLLVQALTMRFPPYLVMDLRRITELTLCGCLMLLLVERHAREAGGRVVAVCDADQLAWAPAVARTATIEQALAVLAARDRDYRLSMLRRRRGQAAFGAGADERLAGQAGADAPASLRIPRPPGGR